MFWKITGWWKLSPFLPRISLIGLAKNFECYCQKFSLFAALKISYVCIMCSKIIWAQLIIWSVQLEILRHVTDLHFIMSKFIVSVGPLQKRVVFFLSYNSSFSFYFCLPFSSSGFRIYLIPFQSCWNCKTSRKLVPLGRRIGQWLDSHLHIKSSERIL